MPETEVKTPDPKRRRVSPGLMVLVVLLLALLWQREEITYRFNLAMLLRAPVPQQNWMRDMGVRDDRALGMMRALWATERIPHRRAVMEYVRSEMLLRPDLIAQSEEMLMEAANGPDYSLRELLITTLKAAKRPAWQAAAMAQLDDADPEIKTYAVTYLRVGRVTNALPRIGALLDDPMAPVRVAAAITVEAFTGQDFGLKSWMGTNPVGLSEEEKAERAAQTAAVLEAAAAWWKENGPQGEALSRRPQRPAQQLPTLNLTTTEHGDFSSRAWLGKPTFVQFFASYCTSCDQVLPEVNELKRTLGEQVNIVGVSLDAIPDEHNHFFDVVEVAGHEGHDHGHSHHEHGHGHHEVDSHAIISASAKLLAQKQVVFDLYYDIVGEATTAADGGEIPVGICLDARGNLVRRFVGPRSAAALAGILKADFPAAFENYRE